MKSIRHTFQLVVLLGMIVSEGPRAELVDPAPISDEVIDHVVPHASPSRAQALHERLAYEVGEGRRLAKELGTEDYRDAAAKHAGRESTAESKRTQLIGKRHEFIALRSEARRQLAEMRADLSAGDLHTEAQRLDHLSSQVEERFRQLDEAIEAVETAEGRRERRENLIRLKALMDSLRAPETPAIPVDPVPTWRADIPKEIPSPPPSEVVPAYVSQARQINAASLLAAAGDPLWLVAAPVTPAEAAQCAYTAADLDRNTLDAKVTTEIIQLAEKLGYSPARIYDYVYNQIQFEPYYGSLKGAQGTLVASSGGPTDQASLLVALLRASNIPARYVKGVIKIADPAGGGPAASRGARWLGAKSYAAAAKILLQGKFPGVAANSDGIQLTQVWVEACVPYGHYRGSHVDSSGNRWVPMDPSFKDIAYRSGPITDIAFDYSNYLSTRSDLLPLEYYEKQIGNDAEGLGYLGQQIPRKMDVLAASLPYQVISFSDWTGASQPDAATIPSTHRYQLSIGVNGSPETSGLTTASLFMPQISLSRLTLSFRGSTAAFQARIDKWRSNGKLSSALPCSTTVVPTLKIDGVEQTPLSPPTAVGFCATKNTLEIHLSLPELSGETCEADPKFIGACINKVVYRNIGAANLHALQAYAFQASDRLLTERAAKLLNAVRTTPNANATAETIDDTEGEFLHLAGLKYLRKITDASLRIGQMHGCSGQSGNHLGLTSSYMKVSYLFDLPFAVSTAGLLVDMPGGYSRSVDITTGSVVWPNFLLSGYESSANEHYLWQENGHLDAISTVRGLQFARDKGYKVLVLSNSNWEANKASLTSGNPAGFNYSFAEVANLGNLYLNNNSLYKNCTVTLPRRLIKYQNWKGLIYVADCNNLNTTNSATASFAISGGYAGGYSLGNPIDYGFNTNLLLGLNSGYQDIFSSNPGIPPISVGSGVIGNGLSQFTSWAGDPVNLVTGNVYHSEKDIEIPGRGGLPLVFERSYNSRDPKNGVLGFGWTHSLNPYLKLYGVSKGRARIGWVDGTGAEKFFTSPAPCGDTSASCGAKGNIESGVVLKNPKGIFVNFIRANDGTRRFVITEKNGLSYTFESATLTKATPAAGKEPIARLLEISDRNGNKLTLNYDAYACSNTLKLNDNGIGWYTWMCSVTDSLGRSLSFTYADERIEQIADWTGRKWKYEYDVNGNLTSVSNPLVVTQPAKQPPVTYAYYTAADGKNVDHAMKSYTVPKGNGMKFEYYANGRAFRQYPFEGTTDHLDEMTIFRYNDFRRETVMVNERGHTRKYLFDEWGNPVKITEENGAVHTYIYDPDNPYDRLGETDALGQSTAYLYDGMGNVVQNTLPSGSGLVYGGIEASNFYQPQTVKDARGYYQVFRYDDRGNKLDEIALNITQRPELPYTPIASQILAWTRYAYDSFGNRIRTQKVRDFATQIAKPNDWTGATGPVVEVSYDTDHLYPDKIIRRGDKTGNGTVTDPADAPDMADVTYDGLGRPTLTIDADWQAVRARYDVLGRIYRKTDSVGQWRDIGFDENGHAVLETLKLTDTTGKPVLVDSRSARYEGHDRLAETVDAGGNVTRYGYDLRGNNTVIVDPDGYTLETEYDKVDRAVRVYDKAGHAVVTVRDGAGRVKSTLDPNGNLVTYEYWDASRNGLLKSVTQPVVGSNVSGRTIRTDYDANGNTTSRTDVPTDGGASRSQATSFDGLNRPVGLRSPYHVNTDPDSPSHGKSITLRRTNGYDPLSNLKQVTAAGVSDSTVSQVPGCAPPETPPCQVTVPGVVVSLVQTTRVYDDFGRLLHETDAKGQVTRYTYDTYGNVKTARYPNGHTLTYTWDYGHVLRSVIAEDGRKTLYTPNALGQVVRAETYTELGGNLLRYSEAMETSGVWWPNNASVTRSGVGPSGRGTANLLTRLAAGNHFLYQPVAYPVTGGKAFTYSVWLKSGTFAGSVALRLRDGRGTEYGLAIVTPTATWTRYSVTATFPAQAVTNIQAFVDPTNDLGAAGDSLYVFGGQLEVGTVPTPYVRTDAAAKPGTLDVAYSYAYDPAHRLQTVTDSRGGKTLTYDWSPGGLLDAVWDSDGNRIHYQYDQVGRIIGIWMPNYDYLQFDHDAGGRLTEVRYPNGVSTLYQWNADDSLAQIRHRKGATVLAQTAYTYDGFGRRKTLTETLSGQPTLHSTYGYDALDRLLSVDNAAAPQLERYAYDVYGNRVRKQIGNPVTATTAYRYDAANQLTEVRQNSLTGTLREADLYDRSGNLTRRCAGTGVTRASDTACTGSVETLYAWDSFNRLAETGGSRYGYDHRGRRIRKTENGLDTHYRYDGDAIWSEAATTGAVPAAVYVHAGTDRPLARLTGSTSVPAAIASFYHADGLGSVLALSDAAGNITATQRFNAFGNRTAASGTIPAFGYTGREPDASGLLYYRARYYDPGLGRFLSRDPTGLAGGINRYAYVGNNPVNLTDPSGLVARQVSTFVDTQVASYFSHSPGYYYPGPFRQSHFDLGAASLTVNLTANLVNSTANAGLSLLAAATTPLDRYSGEINTLATSGLPSLGPWGVEAGAALLGTTRALTFGADLIRAENVAKGVESISPSAIRFSQSSVNGVESIAGSMRANGWQGAPIDVVRMSDGALTTFDNTRVLAAQRAGIDVQALIHNAGDAFPAGRWTPRSGVQPSTWEEAVQVRIQQQNSVFRNTYPSGSPFTGSSQ